MTKEESIITYYYGLKNYCENILNQIQSNQVSPLNKTFYNASLLGFSSLILLSIKEDLVDRNEHQSFESKLIEKELEKCVELIARKKDKGYEIDNYHFKDAKEVVTTLRNKIGHGIFHLDLEKSRIIINVENQDIIININKLSNFIASALNNYYKIPKSNEYRKTVLINHKVLTNRKKIMTKKTEVKNTINNYQQFNITIISKNQEPISKKIIEDLDNALQSYEASHNKKLLFEFQKTYQDNYDISINSKKLNWSNYEDIINQTLETKAPTYEDQIKVLGNSLSKKITETEKLNMVKTAFDNLILAESIYKSSSKTREELGKYIYDTYDNYIIFDAEHLAVIEIALFEALFSYGLDKTYSNQNQFIDNECLGLDYSLIDTTTFVVNTISIPDGNLQELYIKRDSIVKSIDKLLETKEKNETNLENIKNSNNSEVINIIKNQIKINNERIANQEEELTKINNQINLIKSYIKENNKYLYNQSIINGIRNSISHGNYYVTIGKRIEDTYIIFKDIYKGELTFEGKIKVMDFLIFFDNNEEIVINFLDNKNKNVR